MASGCGEFGGRDFVIEEAVIGAGFEAGSYVFPVDIAVEGREVVIAVAEVIADVS